jgi:hypothetical protein
MIEYDPDIYNEVYIEEEGQLVAMAATLDTEYNQILMNEGNLPKA